MKKKLLTALIVAFVSIPGVAFGLDNGDYEGFAITPEDLETERYFRSPFETQPEIHTKDEPQPEVRYSFDHQGRGYSELKDDRAPLFKQVRLKLTDFLYNRPEKVKNDKSEEEASVEKPTKTHKFGFHKKSKTSAIEQVEEENNLLTEEGTLTESIKQQIDSEVQNAETMSLESGISEQVVQKELQLDADNVNYDDETGDMVATGRPVLYLPQQGTTIIADKMTYNQDSNILKCIDNVVVKRNGMTTLADYIEIDMNEETIISENMEAQPNQMKMDAKHAIQKDGLIVMTDGSIHSDQSEIHRLASRMIGPNFSGFVLDDDEKSYFLGNPEGNKININIRELYVDARKNHDVIRAKGIEVNKNGHHLFSWPSLTAYTNKQRDYFEANYPEFGSRRKLGMFIGPGFTFGGPNGSVMKVIPFLNYKSKFGFGGALKYRAPFNVTELGYGSANDIFFLKGFQRLDDNLFLQYSMNSYMDNWFLGARMPKYMVEAYYDKGHVIPNFLTEKRDLSFRHRVGFGLMEDNDRNFYGEKINGTGTSTVKLSYMAEIRQSLYSYKNKKEKFYFNFDVVLQGSAALYGTGDTQFIGRIGPRAHLQYKRWMQDIGYYHSGYDDHTPMPRFDMYRYGRSSVNISEIFRVNKYLSVGWSGTVTLSDDSPNGKLFQENRFAVAIGPDDLKIRFGYDFVRQTTYFGFDVAFDTKGTTVNYKKMEIKNPERLGKEQKSEERQISFASNNTNNNNNTKNTKAKPDKVKPAVLQYAQVINLEDPNKERVD